jgi:hypothetical protein
LVGAASLLPAPLLLSSPHPAPSELPGFIVILLGVFIEKIILRTIIKALRWGSVGITALTGRFSPRAARQLARSWQAAMRELAEELEREPRAAERRLQRLLEDLAGSAEE